MTVFWARGTTPSDPHRARKSTGERAMSLASGTIDVDPRRPPTRTRERA